MALPLRVLRAPAMRALRARAGRVIDALLQGRGWIALVWVLLVGIVFFNVDLLEMNRDITRTAERSAEMKRANARLRLELARLGSSERIQRAAAHRGLMLPAPGDVRYLRIGRGDARKAAKRAAPPNPGAGPAAPTPTTPAQTAPPTQPQAPPTQQQPAVTQQQQAPVTQQQAPPATGAPASG